MKKILVIASVVLIAALGGYFLYKNQKEPAYTGPVERIRVGNVGEYTIFNLIAFENGYFGENGIEAQITEFSSGPASLAAMLKGETDINVAADFVGVRNIFDNPQIRILAQANHHRVFQVASRKMLGIQKPADLRGKKIGVTKNSAGEYFLGIFLENNKLSLNDITMVDLTPADMVAQLESGKIDAVAVFEPHIFRLRSKFGDDIVSWDVQSGYNVSAVLYSTKSFIEENPGRVERYMRALVRAEKFYASNPEKVKEIVSKKMDYEKAYIDYSWPKFTHFIGLNQELILNMESEARWVIKNNLTDKKAIPNYLDFIYLEPLEKIRPEAVTLIR